MGNGSDDKSGHWSDEEAQSELQSLASSLAASKEAMGVLGSALAGHVVGAMQAQGLVPAQPSGQPASFNSFMPAGAQGLGFGGQPTNFQPHHTMGRGTAYSVQPQLAAGGGPLMAYGLIVALVQPLLNSLPLLRGGVCPSIQLKSVILKPAKLLQS